MAYKKTVNKFEGALWLASQTPNILCHSPSSNSRGELLPTTIVIVTGINELKSSFCAILSHCFGISDTTMHLSVGH